MRNRQTKIWGGIVSVLMHILVGLSLLFGPVPMAPLPETPVTVVELIAPPIQPPTPEPDAGEAEEAGGGGGGQTAEPAESETEAASPAEPEPAPEAETPTPTPVEVEVQTAPVPAPEPVVEVAAEPDPAPLPSVPTPIKPRLAVLPAPAEIALTVAAPVAPAAPVPGFLSVAATRAGLRGPGDGAAGGAGRGSGTGYGDGTGTGSGAGSGSGSGSGTGSSAARGPGARCDMLARISQAVRNTPQVRAAVDDLARDANARGQALVIWDGDWITTRGQDGRGLAGVRQAVSVSVAFAPAECKAEPVRGFVVIDLGEGDDAPRVALGKAQWRWNDLLEVERAR